MGRMVARKWLLKSIVWLSILAVPSAAFGQTRQEVTPQMVDAISNQQGECKKGLVDVTKICAQECIDSGLLRDWGQRTTCIYDKNLRSDYQGAQRRLQ